MYLMLENWSLKVKHVTMFQYKPRSTILALHDNPHADDPSVIVANCSSLGLLTIFEKSTVPIPLEEGH